MIWTTLLFIITIGILVTVHEFGHFLVARWCGVKVKYFSIGFGKKLWSHTFASGTEFAISMIPLGGYVKMLDGRAEKLEGNEKIYAFDHKRIWQRTLIVSAGPIANFILAWLIYWVIFQIGIMTYPVKIEQILPNTPAATINIPTNTELKTFNGIKVESWSDINLALISVMGKDSVSFSYLLDAPNVGKSKQEVHQTINIKNWRFDLEKESAINKFGFVPKSLEIYPILSKIIEGSAAEKAGLKVGDEIISYNGNAYSDWNSFAATIKQANLIKLTVQRDKKIVNIDLQPLIQANGEGIAGFYPTSNAMIKQYSIIDAVSKGLNQTALTIQLTVRSLYQLVTGVIGLNNLSGPLSIAKSAGQTANYGIVSYLYFLAFMSVSLGVINLVPLPMLDGGHLLFLLCEKIKGRALSETTLSMCYKLGSFLLICIMGIAIFNDFLRL